MTTLKAKKVKRGLLATIVIIIAGWGLLTLWVERLGESESWEVGNVSFNKRALVIYDPDPFYNLDEKVCKSFGKGLSENGVFVKIATVAAAKKLDTQHYDLYVFCVNTYNWRPDWATYGFIKSNVSLKDKNVIAITLGAGSTKSSQKSLEELIVTKEAKLLDSRSIWLMRPNDESSSNKNNIEVAKINAHQWAKEVAKWMKLHS